MTKLHTKQLFLVGVLFLSMLMINTSASAQDSYKNAVKITFLSWTSGSTKVSYERAFPKGKQSGEICVSMIGAGYDKYKNDPLGFTVRYGHKFFVAGYDEAKPLMGFYLRPEFMYSHYDYTHSKTSQRTLASMGAIMATFGYQLCIKRFIADAWVGGGYAFGTPSETGYHHGFQLWKWFGKHNDNIAMSFSVRVGVLF
jgi:hypothetical protein